jgi:hypothetical protein
MAVMIGVDPHKGSHTAVALDESEEPLGDLRVRSAANQVERLLIWATPFGARTWAIEGAGGLRSAFGSAVDPAVEDYAEGRVMWPLGRLTAFGLVRRRGGRAWSA